MRRQALFLTALLSLAALDGCSTETAQGFTHFFDRTGEAQLKQGIKDYEAGRLADASDRLDEALDAGLSTNDQVIAHKYLAFIACVAKHRRQCRAHFKTALELNPGFELAPGEAGNPAWGPVFRAAKEGRR
jgi:Tfp pilus assembly protein PilF